MTFTIQLFLIYNKSEVKKSFRPSSFKKTYAITVA